MPVRVFHGDDSEAYRVLIGATLPEAGDIAVVGGAGTADAVVAGVERAQPDVVLLDQLGGGELADRVRVAAPGVRVVILSGFAPGGGGDPGLEARADGYVVKTAGVEAIAAAVLGG